MLRASGQITAPRVPLTRMDCDDPVLTERLLEAVGEVARSGQFTLGEQVERFEAEFAGYCQTNFAVGVSSGTEALVLALRALEIGPGHEVIVPANSFIASAEAVTLVGATPRFIDVDPVTHTITAATVQPAITPHTRAIIPVHLYGRTVDMDPILELASARGLHVVEDACQAHGAWYRGRRVGSIGDVGCFSFYPAKNLGAWGDGGAVTTDHAHLADRIRLLRAHGERPRYHHNLIGTTARLDAIQAAVLRVKLPLLDSWNAARRRLGARLTAELADMPVLPPAGPAPELDHVFHQYVISTQGRDALRAHLDERGVATGVHYPVPIHRTTAYAALGERPLPIAERLADRICSLPMFPSMSDADIEQIVDGIRSFAWDAGEPRLMAVTR